MKKLTKIKQTIFDSFIEAYKKGDSVKKNILGEIKTAIILFEKEHGEITDDEVISIVAKIIKKINATIDTCPKDRIDVITQANSELEVLKSFIPEELDEEDTKRLVMMALAKDSFVKLEDYEAIYPNGNMGLKMKRCLTLAKKLEVNVNKATLSKILSLKSFSCSDPFKKPFNGTIKF